MDIDQSLDIKRDTWHDKLIVNFTVLLFGIVLIVTAVQVTARTLDLGGSLSWTQSAARFLLIIGTYLGAAIATRNNEHISISLLHDYIQSQSPTLADGLAVLVRVLSVIFLLTATIGCAISSMNDWNTSIGGISFVTSGVLYLCIGIGLLLMTIYELIHIRHSVTEVVRRRGSTTSTKKLNK